MKAKPLVAGTLVLMMSVNASADIFRFFRKAKAPAPSCQGLLIGTAVTVAGKRTITPREKQFPKSEKPVVEKTPLAVKAFNKNPTLEEATQSLLNYKATVMGQILEREYVLDPFLLAVIAKEHVLLIGPPGNAKTTLAKILLSNIVDESTGQSLFYSMQMNKEITLSDTHGSINYKTMSDKGVVERNYSEGILGAKMAFIDESFDIRPGALRNLLDVLAERGHSQGTKQHKGLTEVVVAATNKTLPEVYEEHNNSEGPRALVDRFAEIIFVPKEMENIKADRAIFRGERAQAKPVHQVTFAELDMIRSLVPQVKVPDHVADLAAIIHFRLAPELEAREVKSAEQYREKVQNGEYTLPPFRASKYMSPRTLGKAGNILKAIVVLDYVEKNGKRSLTATTEDLAKLRTFYQMGGPNEVFLDKQLGRSLKEHEKEQIKSVKIEREVVNRIFDENLKEFNESLANFNLQELDRMAKDYKVLSKSDRNKLMDMFKLVYQQGLESYKLTDKEEITPSMIASAATMDLVKSYIHDLKPAQATKLLAHWEKDMTKVEKQRYASAKKMRKQLYRYGYEQKNEVGASGAKVRRYRGNLKGKVEFVKAIEYKDAESNTSSLEDFDFMGDQIAFMSNQSHPAIVGEAGVKRLATWNYGQRTTKVLAPEKILVVYDNFGDLYELNTTGNYSNQYLGPNAQISGIRKSLTEPNTYYIWSTNGITKVLTEDGSVVSTENIYEPGSYFATDLNLESFKIIQGAGATFRELAKNSQTGAFEEVRSFQSDSREISYNDKLLNISADITLTVENYSTELNFIDMGQKIYRHVENNASEGLLTITGSPDRSLTAIVYTDHVDIHDSSVLAAQLKSSASLSEPLQRLELSEGTYIQGARFDDEGQRIALKTSDGFLIFKNAKAAGN